MGRVEDVQGRIRSRVMGEMPSGAGGGRTHSLYFTLLFYIWSHAMVLYSREEWLGREEARWISGKWGWRKRRHQHWLKLAPDRFPDCSANWFCNKLEAIWQNTQAGHRECVGTKISNCEKLGSFSLAISEASNETPS